MELRRKTSGGRVELVFGNSTDFNLTGIGWSLYGGKPDQKMAKNWRKKS